LSGPADHLADADPIPRIREWLGTHPAVVAVLGGGSERIGIDNKPPYPCLRILETSAGSDGDLRWLLSPELQIEAYGDLDGTPGKEALRRVLYVALGALMELPDAPAAPDGPVITAVTSTRAGGWLPEPSGQPRYVAAVRVFAHA
jgi:hypothetical protein